MSTAQNTAAAAATQPESTSQMTTPTPASPSPAAATQAQTSLAAVLTQPPQQQQQDASPRPSPPPPQPILLHDGAYTGEPQTTSHPIRSVTADTNTLAPDSSAFDHTQNEKQAFADSVRVSVPRPSHRQRRVSPDRIDDPYDTAGPSRAPASRHHSVLDWVLPPSDVPVVQYTPRARTSGERLAPTLLVARVERAKFAARATRNSLMLNTAIGLQVLLGALVTGLSSVVSPSKVGITTSVLGGLSTFVASYLARMRGSAEPELSISRRKDLDQFIREAEGFQMDRGHLNGPEEETALAEFRKKFEDLLGNASGERKLSPA